MSLTYDVDTGGDAAVLHLFGLIDRGAAESLDEAYAVAAATGPTTVELDFSSIEYINSTGIALIVGQLAKARQQGIAIRATGLTAHYRHIFEITRLSDFMEIVQPVEP